MPAPLVHDNSIISHLPTMLAVSFTIHTLKKSCMATGGNRHKYIERYIN